MTDGKLVWLIGALVVFVIAIGTVIPAAITAASGVSTTGTITDELWTGTAATAHAMTKYPITSVTGFQKATGYSNFNDTALTSSGTRQVWFSRNPITAGDAWNAFNVTINAEITAAGTETKANTTALAGATGARTVTLTRAPTGGAATFAYCLDDNGYDTVEITANGAALGTTVAANGTACDTMAATGIIQGLNNFTFTSSNTNLHEIQTNVTALPGATGTRDLTLQFLPVALSTSNKLNVTGSVVASGIDTIFNNTALPNANSTSVVTLNSPPVSGEGNLTYYFQGNAYDNVSITVNGAAFGTFVGNGTGSTAIAVTGLIEGDNNITFSNPTSYDFYQTVYNDTVIAANGSHFLTVARTPKAGSSNVTVNAEIVAGEKIMVYINGGWVGNMTAATETWIDQAITVGSNNISFISTNVDNNITNTTIETFYLDPTNITNVSIASAHAAGKISVTLNGVWLGNSTGADFWTLSATTLPTGTNTVTFSTNNAANNLTTVLLDTIYNTTANFPNNLTNISLTAAYGADNVTWLTGCGYANRSVSNGANTWNGMDSTCLGAANYSLTFAITGPSNVTNVTVRYLNYTDNTDYSLASASGQITPTATGYYSTSYAYGTGVTSSTNALMLLLPLAIAAVVLVLFLRSSGMF